MPDEEIIDDATKLEHPDADDGGSAEAPEPDEPEDDDLHAGVDTTEALGEPDVKL